MLSSLLRQRRAKPSHFGLNLSMRRGYAPSSEFLVRTDTPLLIKALIPHRLLAASGDSQR